MGAGRLYDKIKKLIIHSAVEPEEHPLFTTVDNKLSKHHKPPEANNDDTATADADGEDQ